MSMSSMEDTLQKISNSLPHRPIEKDRLDMLVKAALEENGEVQGRETRKARWEFLLKDEIFKLAATEGEALQNPDTDYYDRLRDRLDLVLTFTEHDVCEQTFPFTVLQDLLETQTIRSCSHVFSWIEERADRLTEGMIPQKGKALILLRTLNDLLRRLSKMGSSTIFCGRILTFLSGVFPLGERSGVNLRGEYGPTWDGPGLKKDSQSETKENKEAKEQPSEEKMQVDDPLESEEDFYTTFWSLQLPFSRPPLFADPKTLLAFKAAVDKVLPVIKEATSKERAMMGNRSNDPNAASKSLKRKREPEPGEETSKVTEYFFAKFLTSPELLDLEIADTHFRRQFLFQLLILLQHLLSFTKAATTAWSHSRNRSLQIDFTLDDENAKWVQSTIDSIIRDFLPSTFPNGILFRDTVKTILEREKNWVQWKNELCAPFDREPWSKQVDEERKVGLEEATKPARDKMREDPPEWEHRLGSAPLTEIWEMGYRDLGDLRRVPDPGTIKDFADKVRMEDRRIEMRRNTLTKAAERLAQARARAEASKASTPAPPAKETNGSPSQESASRLAVASAASPPLHPSLPPKPGSAPAEVPASASAPVPTPTPAPSVPPVSTITPAAPAPPPPIVDDQINKFEENKWRWAWLCLRVAREQYYEYLGKVESGYVLGLERAIKEGLNSKSKKDEGAKEQDRGTSPATSIVQVAVSEGDAQVAISEGDVQTVPSEGDVQMNATPDVEGDVKMEER
ncbi:hypothetical protein NEOLEDRAFT_1119319 [Neolentinus lepideus HHB14362 ss-1]|uniref:THO complex subunit 1 transcription elongation factor-domain-containing protein n=1 Tax=Neolentinus lepideus HHB14362 ss-1 TaxID=1314782 RepID=A0A165QPD6_9AGAM|nr:hypothetical protein NEOLEDRAFT_1119319 [Neolentinus lepideus HHB14362 ss-1]